MTKMLAVGLMSGTSLDGIDAALIETDGAGHIRPIAFRSDPYSAQARDQLREAAALALSFDRPRRSPKIVEAEKMLTNRHILAVRQLLSSAGVGADHVDVVGFHGQTIAHRPDRGWTWQIGDGAAMARALGIRVVDDLRSTDVAAGGQGAPLLPALHAAVFADPAHARAILNLGGIANLTLLAPGEPVLGFDTGPANCLLDAWAARHLGTARDDGGAWARSGRSNEALVDDWLADPYFAAAPPKSTGREVFNLDWLLARLPAGVAPADVQASLLGLSARSIAQALRAHATAPREVYACGGGVHNAALMDALRRELPDMLVGTTAALGIDPDFVEAAGFAWLARARLDGVPGNLPSVTGARGPRVLGAIHAGPRR